MPKKVNAKSPPPDRGARVLSINPCKPMRPERQRSEEDAMAAALARNKRTDEMYSHGGAPSRVKK